MIEELRKKAEELLKNGTVKVVFGYGEGSVPERTRRRSIARLFKSDGSRVRLHHKGRDHEGR